MTLVMKFGGTSVGNAQAIRETGKLITHYQETAGSVVVVASGMGTQPVKVTDLLLNGAYSALQGEVSYPENAGNLHQLHNALIQELLDSEQEQAQIVAEIDQFINRYKALCDAVAVLGELTPRALDAIAGMGEQMSVRILAAYLRQIGTPATALSATEFIVTDNNFQSANPLFNQTNVATTNCLNPLLKQGIIPIVTGFVGATAEGIPTTLGRGGSDFTAAILGQALPADEVWIWTDVDGVMSADPRLVTSAQTIPVLTSREVSELAYYGAKVLHPKTIRPVIEKGIPLRIKNTFNPKHAGTLIVADKANGSGAVKAVTAIDNLALITIEGKGMMGVPGIAGRAFGAVAQKKVNVLLISQASSEQSICFCVPATDSQQVIDCLEIEFAVELNRRDVEKVWANQPLAIVTIVGAGMRGTPGIAGKLFTVLGDAGINIIAIAQGSSECSISLVVDGESAGNAVQQIHTLIT